MTILAVGDELESWPTPNNTTGGAQTAVMDPGQRGGITANSTSFYDLPHAPVSEVWVRLMARFAISVTGSPALAFRNTVTNKDALQIHFLTIGTGGTGLRFSYNSSGVAYTMIQEVNWGEASAADLTKSLDVYFRSGASGALKVFFNGRMVLNLTGNYTTVDTTWNCLRLQSSSATTGNLYGGVIVADETTLGMTLDHLSPNGSGNVSAWAGNFNVLADTSVAPRIDLTNSISSNTPGQSFLATMEDTTLHVSKEMRALQIAARGIIEAASGITSVSFLAREGGTNYTLGNLGLGAADSSFQQTLDLSPAGNAWTQSIINALELGVISA